MDTLPRLEAKRFRVERSRFEQTVLLLQGGGALGSYQAGVYQALAEANLHPDWVAGISIGAVNAALIAGNPPEARVEKLREFWEAVSTPPLGVPYLKSFDIKDDSIHRVINQTRALGIMMFGAPHFFTPRPLSPVFWPSPNAGQLSYYDVTPLKATLERLVDFDRINTGAMRFSVGAVNVKTANFIYFDSTTHRIGPAHIIASGSLPPGFPATEIDGEYYWDGGLVSNTPLQWVLDSRPRLDTLAFQIDLWSARGELPRNLGEADVRQKEIQFSSRTRAATDQYKRAQRLRIAFASLMKDLPAELLDRPEVKMLADEADEKVCNIVHLIYNAKNYEGIAKDYEFSRRTMEEHWAAGYEDVVRAISHPEVLQHPDKMEGVRTFDWAHYRQA
ncbi:patatin-like phospholipase family protein [Bradyrhizobium ottawaense]|uniref:patatin-like phospholipase family protein n=1 Tax=Bradyrhizobium ottawaense TaxID=931866 RepID=UPI001BA57D6D|nr:patatin-like phospholipase family protein [Bradyrhizobium ottawaense]MBR1326874.1 patatin-like phospholipase family protein [Bradyrhizobium ottawaense]